MKKHCTNIFVFLIFVFVIFSSVHQCFAQSLYDFSGHIQIKSGKKEILEEVKGTVDVKISEEEAIKKADFKFEVESEISECGDPLAGESFEVKTFPQDNNMVRENPDQVRLEFDQNAMSKVVGRILRKYGETVRNALDLNDCFSSTDRKNEQTIKFTINHISGMAYLKNTYIKINFSGNSEIRVSDSSCENQKRHLQKISGKLHIPLW